ncbi:MAG: YdeI/OmpD-associated family protein [Candidatus Pacebacteria bacterium]|nr:YdeI/OmpD-associated family protein [Candidatus Paceibacterota bacterium]MBP9840622.1 YdeI/OmpD-associated family protein [Candidatus Paceibacterota bacterium]
MATKGISSGTAHKLPDDMRKALSASPKALLAWEDITPLARNEWICWTITVKTAETRREHITRAVEELREGKRRPCCWMGCPHRKDKAVSKTQKWVLGRMTKSKQ